LVCAVTLYFFAFSLLLLHYLWKWSRAPGWVALWTWKWVDCSHWKLISLFSLHQPNTWSDALVTRLHCVAIHLDVPGFLFRTWHVTYGCDIANAGLPQRYRDSVRAIQPGLPLFLYNYTTHQLHGIFEACIPCNPLFDFLWCTVFLGRLAVGEMSALYTYF
jgi:hypothetical protein